MEKVATKLEPQSFEAVPAGLYCMYVCWASAAAAVLGGCWQGVSHQVESWRSAIYLLIAASNKAKLHVVDEAVVTHLDKTRDLGIENAIIFIFNTVSWYLQQCRLTVFVKSPGWPCPQSSYRLNMCILDDITSRSSSTPPVRSSTRGRRSKYITHHAQLAEKDEMR